MKAENFKIEHIEKILEFYQLYVGPVNLKYLHLNSILEDIKSNYASDGYRIGSKWTAHSKLVFRIDYSNREIIPTFNPNFDPKDRNSKTYEEAQKAGELFKKKSLEYLSSNT